MPDFANLCKAFLCQGEPAYVPAVEYAIDRAIKAQVLGRQPATIDDEAEFFLGCGYDFVPVLFGMRLTLVERALAAGPGGPMRVAQAANGGDPSHRTVRLWAEEGTGAIADLAAFDRFEWPDAQAYPYQDIARLGRILPAEAKVIPVVGYVFAAAWMLVGFERFCLDLAEGGSLAKRVIDRVGQIQLQVVENLLQFDCVGAVCMPDDLAYTHGLMVRPEFLRRYVFPWHQRIGQRVRARGLPFLFHSDGRYTAVIEDLIQCGYHAIHPCEPASMDIVELKQRYGGRLCLCGNINLDRTLTLGTPEEVEEEVRQRIRTVGPGGGYCCGSSNSVTEYVPLANFQAMLSAIRRYGRYPIAC